MSNVYQVINPATESIVTDVDLADLAAVDSAIEKADRAFKTWRSIAPGERAKLLRAFAQEVTNHRQELAQLEVTNSGHTISNALWEADKIGRAHV